MIRIGKTKLIETFYSGKDYYSDGDIENELLEMAKKGSVEEFLRRDYRWPVLYHFSTIRENLLEWYPFSQEGELLEIGAGCGALTGLFCRKVKNVTSIELSMRRSLINAYRNSSCGNLEIMVGNFEEIEPHLGLYDYITLIGVWEYSSSYIHGNNPYRKMIDIAKSHLRSNGKIIIAIENKMGIKYWNGAAEDHTGKQFSGLQNYVDHKGVRTFSKPEIESIFQDLGIDSYSFYYPMPDYKLPETIYTDVIPPLPGYERNYRKDYALPRQYLFNDAIIMDQICSDSMFPYFANSFLIIVGDDTYKLLFCKYNSQRGEKYRTKIEVLKDKRNNLYVKKSPLVKNAESHVIGLKDKEQFCLQSMINMSCPTGKIIKDSYLVEYIDGEDIHANFYHMNSDIDLLIGSFCNLLERLFRTSYSALKPFCMSEGYVEWFGEIQPKTECYSLQWTNVDLSLTNLKKKSDEIVCIDYEWVIKFPIPFDFVRWRMAKEYYRLYAAYIKTRISKDEFLLKVGIPSANLRIFDEMERNFINRVYGSNQEAFYLNRYLKSAYQQNNIFVS